MSRIRVMCSIAIVAIIPMIIYYVYDAGGWALREALIEPNRWLNDGWVQPGAVIAQTTRWMFFVMWSLPVALGVASLVIAMRLALKVRDGVLFDSQVAHSITWIGIAVAGSGLTDIIAACFSPMVKSWHNPDGPLPLRFWFGSEEFGLIFCGFGFCIFGIVMREAIKIARDNEAFV